MKKVKVDFDNTIKDKGFPWSVHVELGTNYKEGEKVIVIIVNSDGSEHADFEPIEAIVQMVYPSHTPEETYYISVRPTDIPLARQLSSRTVKK